MNLPFQERRISMKKNVIITLLIILVPLFAYFILTREDSTAAPTLKMAAATMVTIPLLVLFLCFRKYIMRGVSRSGTKG